jgi:hypothetical protein
MPTSFTSRVVPTRPVPTDLQARYAQLHRDMVEQLERIVAAENHWLIYTLLGWEHLATCLLSHYFVEGLHLQYPQRWPYLVLWCAQLLVTVATVRLVRGRPRLAASPLQPLINRVWAIFFFLACDVVVLNVTADLPVFTFLPVLGTLSSFAFLVLAALVSGRFLAAALVMFASGILIAHFPHYGFLIYGGGWLLVLQSLGVVFRLRQQRWLTSRCGMV